MATTYEKIATTTLGTTAASITFSSIAATYTDLTVILVGKGGAGGDLYIDFNGDTATNYSQTRINGNGSTVTSNRLTNQTGLRFSNGLVSTQPQFYTIDIFSYAGSTYKTALGTMSEDRNGSGGVARYVGLWRSTSAINQIVLSLSGDTFAADTTATIYGILKA
jgi:hypothetical protein